MLKAQQKALAQKTNQGIIQIRQFEIAFYTNFYSNFGMLAGIIGGFAYAALTQIGFPYATITFDDYISRNFNSSYTGDDYPSAGLPFASFRGYFYCLSTFWVSSALCLAAAMHVLLTTVFIQAYGPGLALYGPTGSMAKAADGMRYEMPQIFNSFLIMTISFALSTLFACWSLMSIRAAIASTVILALFSVIWWRSCSRIFNNLYLEYDANVFQSERENDGDDDDDDGDDEDLFEDDAVQMSPSENKKVKDVTTKRKSFKGMFSSWTRSSNPKGDPKHGTEMRSSQAESNASPSNSLQKEASGFLLKKEGGSWSRYHFVLNKKSMMYYYKFKSDKTAVNSRPIKLGEYDISFVETGLTMILKHKETQEHIAPIELKCDTKEDWQYWQTVVRV